MTDEKKPMKLSEFYARLEAGEVCELPSGMRYRFYDGQYEWRIGNRQWDRADGIMGVLFPNNIWTKPASAADSGKEPRVGDVVRVDRPTLTIIYLHANNPIVLQEYNSGSFNVVAYDPQEWSEACARPSAVLITRGPEVKA
jgi:hypothetical protein